MPAQPASHFPEWNGNYVLSNDVLTAYPELGSLVASVISGWSITETNLGWALASLIGAKQPVVMSMYSAARSFEVQRDLLLAAAEAVLPKRYALIFRAGLEVMARSAKHRHRFAHWVWGASSDPDFKALLLVEPKDSWNLAAARIKVWLRSKDPLPLTVPNLPHDKILVYRLDELQETKNDVERAYRVADALRHLAGSTPQRRKVIYRWLCAEADIQTVLKRVKKDRKRSRATQPQQPRKSRPRDST